MSEDLDQSIAIIATGDELMSGDLVDTNSAFLAERLNELGLRVKRIITVGDSLQDLIRVFRGVSQEYDKIIVNGGLGPTRDDYTSQAICEAFGLKRLRHPEAYRHLRVTAKSLNPANLKQADLPENCAIIPNPHGTAVGFRVGIDNCQFYCTPGVPRELKPMWENWLRSAFEHIPARRRRVVKLRTFGLGESSIQTKIDQTKDDLMDDSLFLGFRAFFPYVDIKLTGSRDERGMVALERAANNLKCLFADHLVSDSGQTLEENISATLIQSSQTLACAESCTGGALAASFTAYPGASKFFLGGVTTYSNQLKINVLGVNSTTIESKGAVSEETVAEMFRGILKISNADHAISISGILGPENLSRHKKTGTVCIAYGNAENMLTKVLRLKPYEREKINRICKAITLDLFRRFLQKTSDKIPRYVYEIDD